jgi:hypothetical protein
MKGLEFTKRVLYPEEIRALTQSLNDKQGCSPLTALQCFVIFGLIQWASIHFMYTSHGPWVYFFGGTTILLGLVLMLILVLGYNAYRSSRRFRGRVRALVDEGNVDCCRLQARRIAQAELHIFEEVLFIAELGPEEVLFLKEDVRRILRGDTPAGTPMFPCLHFDVYKEEELLDGIVFPLSPRIRPILIDGQHMGTYVDRYGEPEHMEIRAVSFDALIADINSCFPDKPVDNTQGNQTNDSK